MPGENTVSLVLSDVATVDTIKREKETKFNDWKIKNLKRTVMLEVFKK